MSFIKNSKKTPKKILKPKHLVYFLSFILILISSIIRFQNLWNLGFIFDTTTTQYQWAKNAFEMGVFDFYQNYKGSFDYLPGNLIFLYFVRLFSFILGNSEYAFVATLKLFAWLVEILLAVWLFKIAKNTFKENCTPFFLASLAQSLPSIWFVSSVWGQNDSIVIVLSMASLLLALKSRQTKDFQKYNFLTNPTNISAFLFIVSFWFKLQTILIMPILLLILAKNLSWKKICIYFIVSSFLASALGLAYFEYLADNWENTRFIIISGFSIVSILTVVYYRFLKDRIWNFLTIFLVSFTLISGFFSYLGLENLGKGLFAPVGRVNTISSGASSFWGTLKPFENRGDLALFEGFFVQITPSLIGYLVYILGFLFFFLKLLKISRINLPSFGFGCWLKFLKDLPTSLDQLKFNFFNISLAVFWLCGIYFLFFTKMHSRYLHFSIISSLFLLALNKQIWKSISFWLAFGMLHAGYFLDQIGIYASQNDNVRWVDSFYFALNFDYGSLAGVFMFSGFLLISTEAWRLLGQDNQQ